MRRRKLEMFTTNYWETVRLTPLVISGIIFIIYLFFTMKVKTFPLHYYNLFISAMESILIGFELALINYFHSNVYQTFGKLSHLFPSKQYQTFSDFLKRRLRKSWFYYLTIAVVLVPFLILEFHGILEYILFNRSDLNYFYLSEYTLWSLLFDVFNDIVMYSALFLMAVIFWIIIELVIIVNELSKKYSIIINVFDVDETGGFKPLSSFSLTIVSTYFIILTLAIISSISPNVIIFSNLSPNAVLTIELIIFILILLLGVILFLITQNTIRYLINKGVNAEFKIIYRKYKEVYDRIIEISFNKSNNDNEKELNELKMILEVLEKEERKIKEINNKKVDLKAIITFFTTFLLPIVTKLLPLITNLDGKH